VNGAFCCLLQGGIRLGRFFNQATRQATTAPVATIDQLYSQAEQCWRQSRPHEALALCERVLQRRPRHLGSLLLAGQLHLHFRRPAAALPLLEQARLQAPNEPALLNNLAYACFEVQDAAAARSHAEAALRLQQDYPKARLTLARALDALGEYAAALAEFEHLLERKPEDAEVTFAMGVTAAHAGQLELAETRLRQALQLRLETPRQLALAPLPDTPPLGSDPLAAEQLLWATLAGLAAAGIHAFPNAGTLLGLQREQALLHWDKDVDIGLPLAELAKAEAWFRHQGWQAQPNAMRLVNKRSFLPPGSALTFDLTGFAQEQATGRWLGGFWQQGQRLDWQRVAEYPDLLLRRQMSPAGPVFALAEPEVWLQAVYGPDWRQPDPAWDSVVAARNLRGFVPLTRCYGYLRIWTHWDEGHIAKALSTARHCQRHLPEDSLLQALLRYFEKAEPRSQSSHIEK